MMQGQVLGADNGGVPRPSVPYYRHIRPSVGNVKITSPRCNADTRRSAGDGDGDDDDGQSEVMWGVTLGQATR